MTNEVLPNFYIEDSIKGMELFKLHISSRPISISLVVFFSILMLISEENFMKDARNYNTSQFKKPTSVHQFSGHKTSFETILMNCFLYQTARMPNPCLPRHSFNPNSNNLNPFQYYICLASQYFKP